jgi:hypothetical protein
MLNNGIKNSLDSVYIRYINLVGSMAIIPLGVLFLSVWKNPESVSIKI